MSHEENKTEQADSKNDQQSKSQKLWAIMNQDPNVNFLQSLSRD